MCALTFHRINLILSLSFPPVLLNIITIWSIAQFQIIQNIRYIHNVGEEMQNTEENM